MYPGVLPSCWSKLCVSAAPPTPHPTSLNSNSLAVSSVSIVPATHPLGTSKDFVAHVASFNQAGATPAAFSLDTDNHFLNVSQWVSVGA